MRVLIAIPGLHRIQRGAEVAFESVARALSAYDDIDVTLVGSGEPRAGEPYEFVRARLPKTREWFERWPTFPPVRNEYAWEDLEWAPPLWRRIRTLDPDVTLTCNFPFTSMVLRGTWRSPKRPHVFVTQNGDWSAMAGRAEYRWFDCDGIVCTNPEYYERNRQLRPAALIPNGVDPSRFAPGAPERERFGLPPDRPIVLMVSALSPNKRVEDGVRAVAGVDGAMLVVAGDGPLRLEVEALASSLMPGRFRRLVVPSGDMPALYRSADVFMHLCRDESFGNVYVEALASGVPVLAHDCELTRWIAGDDACLVDGGDPGALTAAIGASLNRTVDPLVAARTAERFAWSAIGARYRTFLHEVARRGITR